MNWITADYQFGMPLMGFLITAERLINLGIKPSALFSIEGRAAIDALFTLLKVDLPDDAVLVRLAMLYNQDGLIMYVTSSKFPRHLQGECIDIVPLIGKSPDIG